MTEFALSPIFMPVFDGTPSPIPGPHEPPSALPPLRACLDSARSSLVISDVVLEYLEVNLRFRRVRRLDGSEEQFSWMWSLKNRLIDIQTYLREKHHSPLYLSFKPWLICKLETTLEEVEKELGMLEELLVPGRLSSYMKTSSVDAAVLENSSFVDATVLENSSFVDTTVFEKLFEPSKERNRGGWRSARAQECRTNLERLTAQLQIDFSELLKLDDRNIVRETSEQRSRDGRNPTEQGDARQIESSQ